MPITAKRPAPHDFDPDRTLAGRYCTCGLARPNAVHSAEAIAAHQAELDAAAAQIAEAQAAHRRRTGERDT